MSKIAFDREFSGDVNSRCHHLILPSLDKNSILSVYPIAHLKRRNVTDIVENSRPPWPDDHYHPIMQGIFGKGCDPLVKRSHDLLNIRCLQPIWRWSSGRTPYFIFLICILPYFVPSLWLLVARMVSTSAVHLSVFNY